MEEAFGHDLTSSSSSAFAGETFFLQQQGERDCPSLSLPFFHKNNALINILNESNDIFFIHACTSVYAAASCLESHLGGGVVWT